MMMPPITICEADKTRRDLRANPTIAEVINSPIHLLVPNSKHETGAVNIKHHVWSTKQPKNAIWDTVLDIKVTSPLFTLLTLAPLLSTESLALIIYELTGNFTVFKPSEPLEEMLRPYEEQLREGSGGWRRVYSTDGKPGDLWMRSPLIDFDGLNRFLEETRGMYGHKRLAQAAQMVTGIVSSPFEAQLSMLLNTPRSKGGEGLASIANNHEVALTAEAQNSAATKRRSSISMCFPTMAQKTSPSNAKAEAFMAQAASKTSMPIGQQRSNVWASTCSWSHISKFPRLANSTRCEGSSSKNSACHTKRRRHARKHRNPGSGRSFFSTGRRLGRKNLSGPERKNRL